MTQNLEHVHFLPWVGKNYETGINGKRIMVLGQSHYCATKEDAVKELTQNVIRYYLNPDNEFEGWMNTYTKFIRALSGEALSRENSKEWWDKLLFYNYVQVPMIGPRIKPSKKDFEVSEQAFFEVLKTNKPDKILVWGKASLYDELPQNKGHQLPDLELSDDDSIEMWAYKLKDKNNEEIHEVEVLPIMHPSAGFDWTYWHNVISTFLINKNRTL